MAELAGLLLAVPSTLALALKFSEYLYQTKRHIDAADQEIVALSLDVRSFATTTDYSFKTLQRVCLKLEKSSSPVFKYLQAAGILENFASDWRRTKGSINKAWGYTESVQSRLKIVARWKWVVLKPDVMALRTEMNSLKESLSLIINTITLERTYASKPDSASRKDIEKRDKKIKDLEYQIKAQVKTISRLQEVEAENLRINSGRMSTPRRSRKRATRLQDALVDLGTSMAEHGKVPDSESPSSSTTSYIRTHSDLDASPTSTQLSTPPTASPVISVDPRQPSNSLSSVDSANIVPIPLPSQKGKAREEPSREDHRDQHRSQESYVPALRRKQRRITDSSQQPMPIPTIPPAVAESYGPGKPKQGDYSSVQPVSRYLKYFSDSSAMRSEPGFISSPTGHGEPIPTTALLVPEFPQNMISVAHASRLDLIIEPHGTADEGESEEVMIEFGNGERRKSSGQVIFRWSAGPSSHKPPFNVKCLVYEHGMRDLVLGKPFVEKRRYYWNGVEDEEGG